ncbi:hypothetical protein Dsin_019132 [Dipteronia sinensis]|uniref:Uncharacterized protein n=1 Tax=Dipteronia sinensis TaxID=43782 RepID=A0AAE0A6S3_9ROSI|nr:hypothetical protein Dsin_019132 [Dipteronia sinensis]
MRSGKVSIAGAAAEKRFRFVRVEQVGQLERRRCSKARSTMSGRAPECATPRADDGKVRRQQEWVRFDGSKWIGQDRRAAEVCRKKRRGERRGERRKPGRERLVEEKEEKEN